MFLQDCSKEMIGVLALSIVRHSTVYSISNLKQLKYAAMEGGITKEWLSDISPVCNY